MPKIILGMPALRRNPMRKLVCLLTIAVTASLGVPTVPSAEAKKKPAPKPVNYDALVRRMSSYYDLEHIEFQKKEPDVSKLLEFVAPSYKSKYKLLFENSVASPMRYIQTRSAPVDIRRAISIKPKSKIAVNVDFCYVTSFFNTDLPNTVGLDSPNYPLVGSRDVVEWVLIKSVWYRGAQTIGPLLSEESQCLLAK
jgi:hypothetical protein